MKKDKEGWEQGGVGSKEDKKAGRPGQEGRLGTRKEGTGGKKRNDNEGKDGWEQGRLRAGKAGRTEESGKREPKFSPATCLLAKVQKWRRPLWKSVIG